MTRVLCAGGGLALLALLPAACAEPPRSPDTIRFVRGGARPASPPIRPAVRRIEAAMASPAPAIDFAADVWEEASQTAARRRDLYRIGETVLADGGG